MIINGKETNLKQFYNDCKPTQDEYETYRKVDMFFILEDINTILFEEFNEATIDDLSDDELERIFDRQYDVGEYEFDSLSRIVRYVIEQSDNPNIEH